MTAAQYRKMACGLCGGHVEYDAAHVGTLANCPHCHQEIVLEPTEASPPLTVMPAPPRMWNFQLASKRRTGAWAWWVLAALVIVGIFGLATAQQSELSAGLGALAMLVLAVLVYFLPYVIASRSNHRQSAPIFVINFFLGWTLIGWVAALAWALYRERE